MRAPNEYSWNKANFFSKSNIIHVHTTYIKRNDDNLSIAFFNSKKRAQIWIEKNELFFSSI